MARRIDKLTDRAIKALTKHGYHGDGQGLWLQVSPTGSKSWIFRYERNGKVRNMGLGSYRDVPLAEARRRAFDLRRLLLTGGDPMAERLAQKKVQAARITFDEAVRQYLEDMQEGESADKWRSTLKQHITPKIGALYVDTIETQHVLLALKPIWDKIPATASRLRGRIERILAWATTHGHRSGENPARWGGHLENLLRANQKATRADGSKEKNHHPALPYGDAPAFMRDLLALKGVAPRALEIAMLTACRTGEVVGAEWSEFDLDAALWTIPGCRMKARREHVVPLAIRAITILRELKAKAPEDNQYVFPGVGGRGRVNEFSMLRTIRRLNEAREKGGLPKWVDPKQGGREIVPHGLRSTFGVWCAEVAHAPFEVIEHALAHAVGNATSNAYQRDTILPRRVPLMEQWASYVGSLNNIGA